MPGGILSWLGRQGTQAVAALVLIGILFPPIGNLLKPYVTEAVFVLLSIAFLRIDTVALKTHFRSPGVVLAATAWTSVVIPVLFGIGCYVSDLDRHGSDLFLALILQGVASPMMAAPALAALMGLDATLVLFTLIASTALIPLTAPLFVHVFVGPDFALSSFTLGARLFAILAGAGVVGFTLRHFFGLPAIERQKEKIDGLNVLVLFVFIAAIMESVSVRFLAAPIATITIMALAFIVFLAVLSVTALLFLPFGRERALAIAFMASQRNMGLMLAATGGALPEVTWLYFALSQFPIYLSPQILKPVVYKIMSRHE